MIASIEDHMAFTCNCGSVRFCLLRSGGIECAGCQAKTPHTWEEGTQCRHCYGKGWNDESKAVDGHYQGAEVFRIECEHCDGTGWLRDR